MGLSLGVLRTFLTVYRAGSATRAAELLGLSQPTVTAQVKSLEADLGKPLFDRLPHGMAPTVAADELADGRLRALGEPELAPINTLFLVSREGFQANRAARAVHGHLLLAGRTW
jgi:hypothetical protein